jgi:nitrite reductase/ring-hydroxylating ferredoxin subunit
MRTPHWQRLRNAPAIGTRLCDLADLEPYSHCKIAMGQPPNVFSLLLIRQGLAVTAFVDLCPHQWLPLTFKGDNVVTTDGAEIVCSNHQARFGAADGQPLSGEVTPNCGLSKVPVQVDAEGAVRISAEQ